MISRQERLELFVQRLLDAPAANTHDEAYTMLCGILDAVEDEFSGVAANPAAYQNDGRMYPPQPDSARSVEGREDMIRYRSRAHNTFIAPNGAIAIVTIGANNKTICSKPGADGKDIEL